MLTLIFPLLLTSQTVAAGHPPRNTLAAWCASFLFTTKATRTAIDRDVAREYILRASTRLRGTLKPEGHDDPSLDAIFRLPTIGSPDLRNWDLERPHSLPISLASADGEPSEHEKRIALGRLASLSEDLGKPGTVYALAGLTRGADEIKAVLDQIRQGQKTIENKFTADLPNAPTRLSDRVRFRSYLLVRAAFSAAAGLAAFGTSWILPAGAHHTIAEILAALMALASVRDIKASIAVTPKEALETYGPTMISRVFSSADVDLFELQLQSFLEKDLRDPNDLTLVGKTFWITVDFVDAIRDAKVVDDIRSEAVERVVLSTLEPKSFSDAIGRFEIDLVAFEDSTTRKPSFLAIARMHSQDRPQFGARRKIEYTVDQPVARPEAVGLVVR